MGRMETAQHWMTRRMTTLMAMHGTSYARQRVARIEKSWHLGQSWMDVAMWSSSRPWPVDELREGLSRHVDCLSAQLGDPEKVGYRSFGARLQIAQTKV